MDEQCNECKEICGSRLTGRANLTSGQGRHRLIAAIALIIGALIVLVVSARLSAGRDQQLSSPEAEVHCFERC